MIYYTKLETVHDLQYPPLAQGGWHVPSPIWIDLFVTFDWSVFISFEISIKLRAEGSVESGL